MKITIDIDKVNLEPALERTPETGELYPLLNDITNRGLQVPILVDRDYNIIDGLRRLLSVKLNGEKQIEAVVAEDLTEAIEALDQAHESFPGYRRAWEIRRGIDHLVRLDQGRRIGDSNRGLPLEPRTSSLIRNALPLALKAESKSKLDVSFTHYREWTKSGGAPLRAALDLLEQGKITPHQIRAVINRDESPFRGDVRGAGQQREFLQSAARQLRAVSTGLSKLGSPVELSREDVVSITAQIRKTRTELYKFIKLLEEAVKS